MFKEWSFLSKDLHSQVLGLQAQHLGPSESRKPSQSQFNCSRWHQIQMYLEVMEVDGTRMIIWTLNRWKQAP